MKKILLALAALVVIAACSPEAPATRGSALSPQLPPGEASAADVGFKQYYKCMSLPVKLGDTRTPRACLAACKNVPRALGCEWKDGTGGFPRGCMACTGGEPEKDKWPNDWGMSLR